MPLTVDVAAYSAWADTAAPPDASDLILEKTIQFNEAAVASGLLQITLNPLTDKVTGARGDINLKLAWPQTLDFNGEQGIMKVRAVLYNFPSNDEVSGSTQDITGFSDELIENIDCKTAAVAYSDKTVGAYKLRLTF